MQSLRLKYKRYKFFQQDYISSNPQFRKFKKELKFLLYFTEQHGSSIRDSFVSKYQNASASTKQRPLIRTLADSSQASPHTIMTKAVKTPSPSWKADFWNLIDRRRIFSSSASSEIRAEEFVNTLLSFGILMARRATVDGRVLALTVFQLAEHQQQLIAATESKGKVNQKANLDEGNKNTMNSDLQQLKMEAEFEEAQIVSLGLPNILSPNRAFAMRIAQSLAPKGHVGALYVLGLDCLHSGRVKEGLGYIEKSADGGNAQAQYHLATLYQTGVSGTRLKVDPAKARKWATAAHENGSMAGTFLLSQFYTTGYGSDGPIDMEKAMQLTLLVAENGEPVAQHNLAQMYIEKFERQLADKSPPPTIVNGKYLLILYAIEYYKMAGAEFRFPPSCVALGMIFESGYPAGKIPKNPRLAAEYFKLAIDNGFTKAEFASYIQDAKSGLTRIQAVM